MQVVMRSIQFSDHFCPTITNMLGKLAVIRVLFSTPNIMKPSAGGSRLLRGLRDAQVTIVCRDTHACRSLYGLPRPRWRTRTEDIMSNDTSDQNRSAYSANQPDAIREESTIRDPIAGFVQSRRT